MPAGAAIASLKAAPGLTALGAALGRGFRSGDGRRGPWAAGRAANRSPPIRRLPAGSRCLADHVQRAGRIAAPGCVRSQSSDEDAGQLLAVGQRLVTPGRPAAPLGRVRRDRDRGQRRRSGCLGQPPGAARRPELPELEVIGRRSALRERDGTICRRWSGCELVVERRVTARLAAEREARDAGRAIRRGFAALERIAAQRHGPRATHLPIWTRWFDRRRPSHDGCGKAGACGAARSRPCWGADVEASRHTLPLPAASDGCRQACGGGDAGRGSCGRRAAASLPLAGNRAIGAGGLAEAERRLAEGKRIGRRSRFRSGRDLLIRRAAASRRPARGPRARQLPKARVKVGPGVNREEQRRRPARWTAARVAVQCGQRTLGGRPRAPRRCARPRGIAASAKHRTCRRLRRALRVRAAAAARAPRLRPRRRSDDAEPRNRRLLERLTAERERIGPVNLVAEKGTHRSSTHDRSGAPPRRES